MVWLWMGLSKYVSSKIWSIRCSGLHRILATKSWCLRYIISIWIISCLRMIGSIVWRWSRYIYKSYSTYKVICSCIVRWTISERLSSIWDHLLTGFIRSSVILILCGMCKLRLTDESSTILQLCRMNSGLVSFNPSLIIRSFSSSLSINWFVKKYFSIAICQKIYDIPSSTISPIITQHRQSIYGPFTLVRRDPSLQFFFIAVKKLTMDIPGAGGFTFGPTVCIVEMTDR